MKRIIKKLFNKEYRDSFVADTVTLGIPIQIKYLREGRSLTQDRLAQQMGTTQAAISRLEDPDYGKLTVSSLLRLASVFDVALIVKFVPFSKFIEEYKDKSPKSLKVKSFDEEVESLKAKYVKKQEDNVINITFDSMWNNIQLEEDSNNLIDIYKYLYHCESTKTTLEVCNA